MHVSSLTPFPDSLWLLLQASQMNRKWEIPDKDLEQAGIIPSFYGGEKEVGYTHNIQVYHNCLANEI